MIETTSQHNKEYRTYRAVPDLCEKGSSVTGYEVFDWPEFKAFMDRLGFEAQKQTKDIVIYLPMEGAVTIEHEYHGLDKEALETNDEASS